MAFQYFRSIEPKTKFRLLALAACSSVFTLIYNYSRMTGRISKHFKSWDALNPNFPANLSFEELEKRFQKPDEYIAAKEEEEKVVKQKPVVLQGKIYGQDFKEHQPNLDAKELAIISELRQKHGHKLEKPMTDELLPSWITGRSS